MEREVNKFVARLRAEYGELHFVRGRKFAYRLRAGRSEVVLERCEGWEDVNKYCLSLLHEVGHALLGHRDFRVDAERVKMECAAWEKTRELCKTYGLVYDEEFAEERLDSYREWLYRRSRCRKCGLVRYQTRDGRYHCPRCEECG